MFFSKKEPKPTAPAASELCATDDVCALERIENERYLSESLDEREAEQLEVMIQSARAWEIIGSNVATFIANNRIIQEQTDANVSLTRAARRYNDRTREPWLAQGIAIAHNQAMTDVKKGILDVIYRDDLVSEGAPMTTLIKGAEIILTRAHNKRFAAPDADSSHYLRDELTNAFQFEYIVRALMQRINEDNPDVLQIVFDPATLGDLPVSLQRIATLDIKRGRGASILIDNAQKVTLGEKTEAERLADYLKKNHLPEGVRKTLLSIKMGMQIMGAPECPFNDMGICTHVLAKLPEDQYPEDLRRDLAARDGAAVQQRVNGLQAFAQRNPVSKILDSTIEFNESSTGGTTSAQNRKRGNLATQLEKRDVAMVETAEVESPAFERVVVRVINQNEPFIIDELSDTSGVKELIAQLMNQKIMKKYVDTYHDSKVSDMLTNALEVIATKEQYIGIDRTITPWVDMSQKAHMNDDGVKERFMRYSGARASGVSGGPIGKRTRVIFSHGTKDGTRYVTIHKVAHRSDLESNPVLHR